MFQLKNVHDNDYADKNNRLLKMTSFIKFTKVINCNICRECNWYSEISDDCNIALELCAYWYLSYIRMENLWFTPLRALVWLLLGFFRYECVITYTRFKDGQLLKSSERIVTVAEDIAFHLIINNVVEDDAGTYKCVLTNSAGEISSQALLIVDCEFPYLSNSDFFQFS